MAIEHATDPQNLHCMEIWGGIEPVESAVKTPGLDLWVFSQPFEGDEQGGDVYYVTLCGGGLITRIVVADVSGHGSTVAEFSSVVAVVAPQAHQPQEPDPARRAAQPAVRRDGPAATVRDGRRGHLPHIHRRALRLQRRPSPPALLSGRRRHLVGADPGGRRSRANSPTCRWVSTTRRITAHPA